MFLVFDTETTGLPDWGAPSDADHQPHIVQLAMVLLDADLKEQASVSLLIKPEGWTIPDDVAKIHGITTEKALKFGVPEKAAARLYAAMQYDTLATAVGHNISFDLRMMRIALLRAGFSKEGLDERKPNSFCTMKSSTHLVNLPPTAKMTGAGFTKPKPPKLAECIEFFFKEKLEGAHDALVDCRACARIFQHLTREVAPAADVEMPAEIL